MRNPALILIIFCFTTCCVEKECTQSYLSIGAIRFSRSENDTILVKRFVPPSAQPAEVLLLARERNAIYQNLGVDTTLIFIVQPIDFIKAGSNYEISIPATGHTVNITDFTEIQGTWKDCRASAPEPCRTQISYKANGNATSSETVWINR